MKYIELLLALPAIACAYDQSEGPTKVDNGELDQVVVSREHDIANGFKYGGWHNPLMDADSGAGDESVIAQLFEDISKDTQKNEMINR